jgi:hypothetical protein
MVVVGRRGCGCCVLWLWLLGVSNAGTKWIVSFLQLELETPDGFAFAGQNNSMPPNR